MRKLLSEYKALALTGLLVAFAAVVVGSQAAAQPSSNDLRSDPALGRQISISVQNTPLSTLMARLTSESSVRLSAAEPDSRQRISVRLSKQTLAEVMTKIAAALSHGKSTAVGWHWVRSTDTGTKYKYLLTRSNAFLTFEAEESDYARKQAKLLLCTLANAAHEMQVNRNSPSLKALPSIYASWFDNPVTQMFCDALRVLSPADIDKLVSAGSVPLPAGLFADEINAYNMEWRQRLEAKRSANLEAGLKDPFPNGVPNAPAESPAIEFKPDDYDGELPDRAILYGIWLSGVQTVPGGATHLTFEPFKDCVAPLRLPVPAADAPVLDFAKSCALARVTGRDLSDYGKVLHAVAAAAGRDIIIEQFYKPGYRCGPHPPLTSVSYGTFEAICNLICDNWDLQISQVDGTYYVYSKTWATDRKLDIPDDTLNRWRSLVERNGKLSHQERSDAAKMLSWPQVAVTLRSWLPETGPWTKQVYTQLKSE
jgi:hypothetical protein